MERPHPTPRLLLWTAMIVVVVAVLTTLLLTNLTLRTIEENLPNKLIKELFDLDLMLEDLAEVVTAVQVMQLRPSAENLIRAQEKVETVYRRIATIRDSYVFDNLVNASTFHAVVAPAIADLKIWLTEGVSGYAPQSGEVIAIALDRITTAFERAKQLNHESQATAQRILDHQRRRLAQFLFNVNLLFILTIVITSGMIFLMVRQSNLERREMGGGALDQETGKPTGPCEARVTQQVVDRQRMQHEGIRRAHRLSRSAANAGLRGRHGLLPCSCLCDRFSVRRRRAALVVLARSPAR